MKPFKSLSLKEKLWYIGIMAIYPIILLYEQIGKSVKFLNSRSKQITASILTVSFLLTMIPLSAITVFAAPSGSGTSGDPYVVSTGADFKAALQSTANTTNYIKLAACIDFDGCTVNNDAVVEMNGYTVNTDGYVSPDTDYVNMTFKNGYINAAEIAFFNSNYDSANYILENVVVTNTGDICVYAGQSEGSLTATNCSFTTADNAPIEVNRRGAVFTLTDCYLEGAENAYKQSSGTLTLDGNNISGNSSSATYNGGFANNITRRHAPVSGTLCTVCNDVAPHTHDEVTFEPWTATDSLPTTSGNYYLEYDVTLNDAWYIIDETLEINLCLNGKKINLNGYGVGIDVGKELTIYDCGTNERKYFLETDEYSDPIWIEDENGTFSITGGVITGGTSGCIQNYGTLTINGGNFVGNVGECRYNAGGMITNFEDALFTFNNGHIAGNYIDSDGYYSAVIYNLGTFVMTGGEIYNNIVDGTQDGAIFLEKDYGSNIISGGVVYNNIACYWDTTPTIANFNNDTTVRDNPEIYLADGYAFYDKDGNEIAPEDLATAEYLEVKEAIPPHAHGNVTYDTPWSASQGTVPASFNYYLKDDITAEGDITFGDGTNACTVNFCLNGKTLDMNEYKFTVAENATVNICDCGTTGKITGNHLRESPLNNGGKLTISSGTFESEKSTVYNYGDLEISGGSINSTEGSYAIWHSAGDLYIYGNPTIRGASSAADVYLYQTAGAKIYGAKGSSEYTGEKLRIGFYNYYVSVGDTVVYGTTNTDKFGTADSDYGLKPSGNNLVLVKVHAHDNIAFDKEWTAKSGTIPAGNYYLTDDFTATGVLTVASGTEVNLCLNGHTLDLGSRYIRVQGTFNIYDCQGGEGAITSATSVDEEVIYNRGTVTLYSGKIVNTGSTLCYGIYSVGGLTEIKGGRVDAAVGINNRSTSTLNVSGDAVITGSGNYGFAINNQGIVNVSGGEIVGGTFDGIYNANKVTVTGGLVRSNVTSGICNSGSSSQIAELVVSGGTVQSGYNGSSGIRMESYSKTTISGNALIETAPGGSEGIEAIGGEVYILGGTVKGGYAIKNEGANVYISGGTLIGSSYSVYNGSVAEITGGTITSKHSGVYNYGTGTVKITDGNITGTSYGIYNRGTGTVTVLGGTVKATNSDSYGVYNYSTGTIKLLGGEINGANYGIYNSDGTIEVAGGTLTGTNSYGIYSEGGYIYLSGSPTISGSEDIYRYSGEIYAHANGDINDAYEGGPLTVKIRSRFTNGVVVYEINDNNAEKFSLAESCTQTLVRVGDNLIVDGTAPTLEIKEGTNVLNKVLNTITFGLFFKNTKQITIVPDDNFSGVDKTYYFVSDKVLGEGELDSVSWELYDGAFSLNPKSKNVIYAYTVDKAGNESEIYGSDGIIIYTDSKPDTESVTYTLTTNTDKDINVTLNGNTVKSISLGGNEIDAANYTVDANGKITLKGTYLNTLSAGTHTFTVTYNPLGETYVEADGNEAPDTTTFKVKVEKAEGKVDILTPISKTYNGTPVEEPRYDKQSTGEVVIEYKVKGADDSTYTTTAPINAGEYTVRVTVKSDSIYKEAFDTSDFVIQKKPLSVRGISWDISGSPFTYDGTEKSVTLIGTLPAGVVVEKSGNTATNAGSYTATATFKLAEGYDDGNYEIFGATDNKVSASWSISPKSVVVAVEVIPNSYTYTGEPIVPSSVIVNDGGTVIPESEYNVAYMDNTASGTATVIITDKDGGNYTVSGNGSFAITKATPIVTWPENLVGNQGDTLSSVTLPSGFSWDNGDSVIVYDDNNYGMTYTPADTDNYNILKKNIKVNGLDVTFPTGEINLKNNKWNEFLNNITFGLFFKETQSITITAVDTESGVKEIAYYLSAEELSIDDVKALENSKWTVYDDAFNVEPDNKYVVYARITDNAGNIIYINSDGIVLDSIKPVIAGVEDGKVFYGDATFTVDEAYLDTVTLDGEPIDAPDGKYSVPADNKEHTIVVTDKTGNQVTYKLAVYKNYKVSFVVDGKEISSSEVGYGKDATLPEIPAKDGYTAKWDVDGKSITADTVITAVYEKIPQTGDNTNIWMWAALLMLSGISILSFIKKFKKKAQ